MHLKKGVCMSNRYDKTYRLKDLRHINDFWTLFGSWFNQTATKRKLKILGKFEYWRFNKYKGIMNFYRYDNGIVIYESP